MVVVAGCGLIGAEGSGLDGEEANAGAGVVVFGVELALEKLADEGRLRTAWFRCR